MAALPKRRITKGRRNRRRSQDKLVLPATSICPKCKKTKRPHFVCEYCGFYGKVKPEAKTETAPTKKTTKK